MAQHGLVDDMDDCDDDEGTTPEKKGDSPDAKDFLKSDLNMIQ